MADSKDFDAILQLGITAAKAGDKTTARNMLRKVTDNDQYNEEGWFWLSQVVDGVDEKKVALGNVLLINPGNKKAQAQLDALTGNVKEEPRRSVNPVRSPRSQDMDSVVGSGASANMPSFVQKFVAMPPSQQLLIGGGIIGGLLLLVLILAISVRGSGDDLEMPTVAVIAQEPSATTEQAAVATAATAAAVIPPTSTPIPTAERIATWTLTFTPPPRIGVGGIVGTPLAAAPAGLFTGRMVAMVGTILTIDATLPIALVDPASGGIQVVVQDLERGANGLLIENGTQIIYSRYFSGTESRQVQSIPTSGGRGQLLSDLWGKNFPISDQETFTVSPDGELIAVAGLAVRDFDSTADIFFIRPNDVAALPPTPQPTSTRDPAITATTPAEPPTIAPTLEFTLSPTPDGIPITRLTEKDSGVNTMPAIASGNALIAFVGDRSFEGRGVDLFTRAVANPTAESEINLTKDGDAIREANPRWSPDAKTVAFQGKPDGSEVNKIYVINADGLGRKVVVEDTSDNINPVWSPDGKYLAFSSNRTSVYQIFVLEVATGTIYQVTQNAEAVYITDWR